MSTGERTQPMGSPAALGGLLADRYELTAAVGRGGMADVWRARDRLLDRTVAIKIFRCGTGHDARRKAEAVALASLSHPGLVTVFDAVLPDADLAQTSYLVTEFVDGPNLRQQLNQDPDGLSPAQTARLGGQLAAALGYVHAAGIVHRDVKPANILLGRANDGSGPQAKLADFGVALLSAGDRMTEQGTVVGTANYVSPEQLTGAPVGPPSDVYSLGLVLLECLTGAVVYPGSGVEAAFARLHRQPDVPEGLPPAWRELLVAMVDAEPSARPEAVEVARRLGALADAAAAPDTAPFSAFAASPADVQPTVAIPSRAPLRPGPGGVFAAPGAAARTGRFLRRRWWLPTGAAAAAVVAVLLGVTLPGAAPAPAPSTPSTVQPSYPVVPGRLGRDLAILQRDVQP